MGHRPHDHGPGLSSLGDIGHVRREIVAARIDKTAASQVE